MVTVQTPLTTATTVTSSATASAGKHTPVDATSGAVTMTLPTPAHVGARLHIEKIDTTSNVVTVSGTIRGISDTLILNTQYHTVELFAETLSSWRVGADYRTDGVSFPATTVSKTTTYTAVSGNFVLADVSGGGFTVTLPSAPSVGALVGVKKTDSSTNTLTIAPAGSGNIDGDPTATTTTKMAGALFEHIGSDVWRVVASMTSMGAAQGLPAGGTTGQSLVKTSNTDYATGWSTVTGSGSALTPVSKTTTYTAVDGDLVVANASGGAFTVTLPTPTLARRIGVRKVDSSANAVTVTASSGNVDGTATWTLTAQWQTQVYVADGTNWQRLDVPGVAAIAASGTPSSTTFLRGDGTWSTPAGGSTPSLVTAGPILSVQQPVSNNWNPAMYPGIGFAQGVNNQVVGACLAVPVMFSTGVSIKAMAIGCHSNGDVTALLRVGLYADNGSFYPGSLMIDAGTQAPASSLTYTLGTNQAMSALTVYWAVLAYQGTFTTCPNVKASGSTGNGINGLTGLSTTTANLGNLLNAATPQGWYMTGVSGALPGTFAAASTVSYAGSGMAYPIIALQVV